MSDETRHNPTPEPAPSAEELSEARRLGDALDALDAGRSALDRLPSVGDDDALPELVAMSHALRAGGPAGELAPTRREALWDELEASLERASSAAHTSRPRRRWWMLFIAGPLGAAALALIVFWVGRSLMPGVPEPVEAPAAPAALAEVEAAVPSYAQRVLSPSEADPRGDTRLRDYRQARFEAWRTDTTWQSRYRGARMAR